MSNVWICSIALRFAGSSYACWFAISSVYETRIVSRTFSPRPATRPVSVISTTASAISGILASVAP